MITSKEERSQIFKMSNLYTTSDWQNSPEPKPSICMLAQTMLAVQLAWNLRMSETILQHLQQYVRADTRVHTHTHTSWLWRSNCWHRNVVALQSLWQPAMEKCAKATTLHLDSYIKLFTCTQRHTQSTCKMSDKHECVRMSLILQCYGQTIFSS